MKCPQCGNPLRVYSTKVVAETVVRYRKCSKCKYRKKTVEA